jgi:hypothetical protein
MADIRIKDLATTASTTASDDFMAVDGTTNGTRKLSAATPSFATSVTVPGVSAPASTALTLAGGTSGASLVLGHSLTGGATLVGGASVTSFHRLQAAAIAFGVNTFTKIALGSSNGSVLWLDNGGATSPGVHFYTANNTNFGIDATNSLGLRFVTDLNETAGAVKAVITRTGNLLIGTTTDITGTGGLHVAGTGTASTTTSGALRVGSNVGLSGNAGGASYFGGTVSAPTLTDGYITISAAQINRAASFIELQYNKTAGGEGIRIFGNTANAITFSEARMLLSSSPAATAVGTGGLQSPNFGLSTISGGASYFGGSIFAGDGSADARIIAQTNNPYALAVNRGGSGNGRFYLGATAVASPSLMFSNNAGTEVASISDTGAATFAGAVAIGNTVSSVSPTSPNRTITIVVGGVTLYIAAKTTND